MPNTPVPAAAEGMSKIDCGQVMRQAWADYRRDVLKGWGVPRGGPFNRAHFAYCLRMAWAVAKQRAAMAAQPATVVLPAAPKVLAPAAAARARTIRNEIESMQYRDRIDWTQHRALQNELSALTA